MGLFLNWAWSQTGTGSNKNFAKGRQHEISTGFFFFVKNSHLCPILYTKPVFEYDFEFADIFECVNDPAV